MTRKEALLTAIWALNKIEKSDVPEIQEKLRELVKDLPVTNWDKAAILDAVEQYRQDHGKYPGIRTFDEKGLPTRKIVERQFAMPLEAFMKTYFPASTIRLKASSEHRAKREYWLQQFGEFMQKNPNTTNITYNQHRAAGTPSWQMIAAMYQVKRWNELLELCQLPIRRGSMRPSAGEVVAK